MSQNIDPVGLRFDRVLRLPCGPEVSDLVRVLGLSQAHAHLSVHY